MKKIISVLLSVFILVGCLPLAAFKVNAVTERNITRYSVLVLDVSDTAEFLDSGGKTIYTADSAIDYVKKSANSFLSDLINAKGDNYVAVVTFAGSAAVEAEFTNDINQVTEKVNGLTSSDTVRDINAGLTVANNLLQQVDDTAVKNVILVTTGMTNAGNYTYEGHYNDETVGSKWRRSDTQIRLYAYANAAYETAEIIKDSSTLYVLGIFQTMANIPQEGKDIAEFFILTAFELASSANTFFNIDDPDEIEFVFGEIVDDITASKGFFKYAGQINQNRDSIAEYWYSDTYFTKKATVYNASLATMSLCLELSTWSSYEKDNWYNPAYTQDDAGFWQDKLCNVKALLLGAPDGGEGYEGLGFTDFMANSFWQAAPTKDSIGVCAARKQVSGRSGEQYTLIALVVRGGGYGSEWASNFTLGESGEHDGFATARDNVLTFLDSYISTLNENESKKVKIWITGYSRAGATANMVAGALDSYHSLPDGFSTSLEDIYCYTFEAPQGAVRSDVNGDYSNIFNVLNLNDLVPLVAPYSWGFARYNYQNDKTLPSKYTTNTAKFNQQLTAMLVQLYELGYTGFDYKINEVSTMQNLKIDKSKFLPLGDPLWWWEESSVDTHTVLQSGVNYLADDVIPSREYYYNYLEYCVRQLLGIIMDYYGVENGLMNYAGELAIKQFLSQFNELFTFGNITYIISPMISLNPFYSYDSRIKDVKLRLGEKVGGIFGELAYIDGFIDSVVDILTDAIVQIADDMWNNNTDTVNLIIKLVDTLVSSEMQGHYPEICLAWCRSLDPNYNDQIIENNSSVTRQIRINCPVNVEVYDSEGILVASIFNNVCDESIDGIINLVNDNGEKILYLPGDETYTVGIFATDDGMVNFSLSEYNFVYYENTRLQNYYDIPVNMNDTLTAVVPAIFKEELEENNIYGSTADYQLYCNDSLLTLSEEFTGEGISQEYYTVTLKTEGNGGYVDGAGSFIRGSFAKVEAYTLPGAEFLGWYTDDQLLSSDPEYRFNVTEDTVLTAKFNDVTFHDLDFETDGNGAIHFTDGSFPANVEITLEAIPDDGYEFVEWTSSNGGAFEDPVSESTVFTMPANDTTVTAHFRQADSSVTGYEIIPDNDDGGLDILKLIVDRLEKSASSKTTDSDTDSFENTTTKKIQTILKLLIPITLIAGGTILCAVVLRKRKNNNQAT